MGSTRTSILKILRNANSSVSVLKSSRAALYRKTSQIGTPRHWQLCWRRDSREPARSSSERPTGARPARTCPPVISTIVMSRLFARRQRASMSAYFTNSLTPPVRLGLLASPPANQRSASPPSIAISPGRPVMKKLGMLGIIGGAALLTVAPFSLQWSQDEVSLSLSGSNATSVASVHRRVYRRTYRRAAYATAAAGVAGYGYGSYYGYGSPYYSSYYAPQPYASYYRPVSVRTVYWPYPPSRYSYYLPPFASVSSYDAYLRRR